MDWNRPYSISRSLTMQFDRGRIVLTDSVSRPLQQLESDGTHVLLAFIEGTTPIAAFARLSEHYDLERDGFETVVQAFLEQGVLVDGSGTGTSPGSGFASLVTHLRMLRDSRRVLAYREAIRRHVRGRDVVEVGAGTGILSVFAAQAGARTVMAIEETRLSNIASDMAFANGVSEVVSVWTGNSKNFEPVSMADVVIHEIIGSDPLDEGILTFLADARERLLKPGGRFIPWRLEVLAVAFEAEAAPPTPDGRMVEIAALAKEYDVNFGPFVVQLAKADAAAPTRRLEPWPEETLASRILSTETQLYDIDFYSAPDRLEERAITFAITKAGRLDGVVIYFRAHLDEETVLTNSPFTPITSWGRYALGFRDSRAVEATDRVEAITRLGLIQGRPSLWVEMIS